MERERPAGITLISIVAIVGGLLQIAYAALPLVGGLLLLGIGPTPLAALGILALVIAAGLILGAVAQLAFGVGLLRRAKWAWTAGVLVSGFNALLNVIATMSSNGWGNYVGLFLSGAVLFYLTSPKVKAAFGR